MSPVIEDLKEAIIHACGGLTHEEVKYVVNKYLEKELHKLRKERDFWMRKATIPRETMDLTVQTTEATRISEEDLKELKRLAVLGKWCMPICEPEFSNADICNFSTTRIRKDAEDFVETRIETELADVEKVQRNNMVLVRKGVLSYLKT